LEALERINYVVTDLEGDALGAIEGNTVYLDIDAAGRDWFIDETEWLDEEFASYEGYWDAITEEAIAGIDLLTVIMHEQGHILGLLDLEESSEIDGLMGETLGEGERWLPVDGLADGAVAGSLEGVHYVAAATDDGSAGSPLLSTSEDNVLNSSPTSLLTNDIVDTGAGNVASVLTADATSAAGATISINPNDGTFTFDPTTSNAAQALDDGESLIDTFDYVLLEAAPPTAGITLEMSADTGVNTLGFSGAPLNATVAATGTGVPAGITKAFDFSGTAFATRDDFGQGGGYNTSSASFEFWIRPDVVDANQTLFETGGTGTGSGLYINDDGTVSWFVKNNSNALAQSTATLTAGEWQQIVITYDRNQGGGTTDEVKIYINSILEGSGTSTNTDNWSGSDNAGLGGKNQTSAGEVVDIDGDTVDAETYGNFDGQMGLVRFYSGKVLTGDGLGGGEVGHNYNALLNATVDTATATIEVTGVNDAPVAYGENIALSDRDTVALNLLVNDSDVDSGDIVTVTTFNGSPVPGSGFFTFTTTQGATVTVAADGSFTYDGTKSAAILALADGATLTETFSYDVSDGTTVATTPPIITITSYGTPGASNDLAEVDATIIGGPVSVSPPVNIAALANDSVVKGAVSTATTGAVIELLASNGLGVNSGIDPVDDVTVNNSITFGAGASLNGSPGNVPPGITAVYTLSGTDSGSTFNASSQGIGTAANPFGGDISLNSTSLEFVFRPTDQSGNVSIFDAGGASNGGSLVLLGNQLVLTFGEGAVVAAQAVATLPESSVAGGTLFTSSVSLTMPMMKPDFTSTESWRASEQRPTIPPVCLSHSTRGRDQARPASAPPPRAETVGISRHWGTSEVLRSPR